MTDIDVETGLPKLPEGYFWRVNRESVEIRKKLEDTEWRDYDYALSSLVDPARYETTEGTREDRTVEKTRTVRVPVYKWWRVPSTTYVEEEKSTSIKQYRYVNRSVKVVEAQTEKNGETTRIPGRYHSAEYRSRYGGYHYSYLGQELVSPAYTEPDPVIEHRHPVTKDNILSVCEKALEKFEALELLGDYPPKRLEDVK